MKKRSLALGIFLVGFGFVIAGCESDEERTIAAARTCLDGATASTVETCSAMVAGLTSPPAYLIRCATHYIYNGFTTATFASAFQNIKDNPSSGNNAMVSTMAFLAFSATSGSHGSDVLQSDCNASGSKGMQRLALMTGIATTVGTVAGLTQGATEAQMLTAIQNFVSNGGNASTLGTLAVSASTLFCNSGSAFESNDVCKTIKTATASGDTAAIGAALLAQLQSNPQ